MITWDNPLERYYETGLDRGVLYPKGSTQKPADVINGINNPSSNDGTTYGWQVYGLNTTLTPAIENGQRYFVIGKSVAGSNFGMRTLAQGFATPGMAVYGAGYTVTIQCEVRLPTNQGASSSSFIARDDTNNDSGLLNGVTVTDGAITWNVPADNQWHLQYVTFVVPAGRNFEGLYIQRGGASLITDVLHVRKLQTNYGGLVPYFDGDKPLDGDFLYKWSGTQSKSYSGRYPNPGKGVPWNGLSSFDEGSAGETTLYYRDGRIYLADVDPSDFQGKMTALYWPDEFAECLGIPKVVDGLYADNQKAKRFDMTYRTLCGSGMTGDLFGYQIHLLYNCMASYGSRNRKSKGSSTELTEFSFDIVCTPVKLTGLRPTAHYIIDTRGLGQSTVKAIEDILYGTASVGGRMPSASELYDLLNFGSSIKVHEDANGDVTFTGGAGNVFYNDAETATIKGVNAVTAGDGTITISQGGNTTIV